MGGPCARPVHVNLSNITCINPRFLSANCANLFIVRYRSQNIKAGGYRRPEKFSSLHILVRQKKHGLSGGHRSTPFAASRHFPLSEGSLGQVGHEL
jgi:hypothetical protein